MTVRLKALKREQEKTDAVNGLFDMFNLPHVSSQGYQVKPNPRPELTGGSTPNDTAQESRLSVAYTNVVDTNVTKL